MRGLLTIRTLLKGLRCDLRQWLGRSIARMRGPRSYQTRLDAGVVASVLVCRINGRLGNAVFLTPLIDRIHAMFPGAVIDLAMSVPPAEGLLKKKPGVRQIIAFPHKGVDMVWRYLSAVRRMRATHYDVVIDPIPESTGGRIVLSLCRASNRIGYANGSQWAPLTHAIPEFPERMHQGAVPVYLLSNILGVPFAEQDIRLALHLQPTE